MDLIAQQQTMKQIRNPFCDLVISWDSRKMLLKKNTDPITLIGRLADHAAKHLYSKVWNQYHDTEKAKLLESGREKEARRYRVPQDIENKIWYLITGEMKHTHSQELLNQEMADLSELSKAINKLESVSAAEIADVSKVLEQANMQGLEALGNQESASVSGGGNIIDRPAKKDILTEAIDNTEVSQPEEPEANEGSTFADLEMAG